MRDNSPITRACRFDAAMRDSTDASNALTDDVLRGLDADEFEPDFQTQHDAATGAVVGVEALVRRKHPTRGLLTPASFHDPVAVAGRMADLDHRMMRRAAQVVHRSEDGGGNIGELSVNVSCSRLQDPDLLEPIRELP